MFIKWLVRHALTFLTCHCRLIDVSEMDWTVAAVRFRAMEWTVAMAMAMFWSVVVVRAMDWTVVMVSQWVGWWS